MSRVRVRALKGKSKKFFAFGGTAEARLPSILAANASMPPRCRVSHTSALWWAFEYTFERIYLHKESKRVMSRDHRQRFTVASFGIMSSLCSLPLAIPSWPPTLASLLAAWPRVATLSSLRHGKLINWYTTSRVFIIALLLQCNIPLCTYCAYLTCSHQTCTTTTIPEQLFRVWHQASCAQSKMVGYNSDGVMGHLRPCFPNRANGRG